MRALVLRSLKEVLPELPDDIVDSTPLSSLGLSSLNLVRFVVLLEEQTGMMLPDEDLLGPQWDTVGTLCDFLKTVQESGHTT